LQEAKKRRITQLSRLVANPVNFGAIVPQSDFYIIHLLDFSLLNEQDADTATFNNSKVEYALPPPPLP
jgi:hypothetical protein